MENGGTEDKESDWTHKRLVRRMADWLKHTKHMTVVIADLSTRNTETPDVIGWIGGAASVLIECKVSRADFLGDKKKSFRRHEEDGMGDKRYVAAPPSLIRHDELPDGWGLLEPHEYQGTKRTFIREIIAPQPKVASKRNECVVLMSALRRLEIATAVYVVAKDDIAAERAEQAERIRDQQMARANTACRLLSEKDAELQEVARRNAQANASERSGDSVERFVGGSE